VLWNRKLGVLLRKRGLLVLDAFNGHFTLNKSHNHLLKHRPCGYTWGNDITAAGVNRPFRDHIKQFDGKWLFGGDHALIPDGRIRKPIVTTLCQWIITAWQHMSPA
jgi:hypothetical protein